MNTTNILDEAVKKVKTLPPDQQAAVADFLEDIVAQDNTVFTIPPEDRAAVEEGIAQLDRGEGIDIKDSILGKRWSAGS